MIQVIAGYRRYLIGRRFAPGTIKARTLIARKWLFHIGDRWVTVGHGEIEDWIGEQAISPAAQRNYVTIMRGFYRWALRDELVDRTPMTLVDPPRLGRRQPRPARDAEIADVIGRSNPQLAAIIGVMACGALRCCEVAGLRWSDIDLHQGTMFVVGKGSHERTVALPDEALVLLARLDTDDGAVFRSKLDRPITAAYVSRLVSEAARAAGYTWTAHQLRHRAATMALQVPGAELLDVRDFLGHSSVATTQIYTKVVPGRAAAMSRQLRLP